MTDKKVSSVENYCGSSGKNLKELELSDVSTKKLVNNNCSECGQVNQVTYSYCGNCGLANEEITMKQKKIKIDGGLPMLPSTSKIDILYILKAVGIVSLIGLSIGIVMTLVAFKDVIEVVRDLQSMGLMPSFISDNMPSAILSVGLLLWRFISFIPFSYGYGELSILDTPKFIEAGEYMGNTSTITIGVATLFISAIAMIYIMFVFGKRLAKKHIDNYIVHALAFSGIYSLVLCITMKSSLVKSFIIVAIISFIAVFGGCKYIELNNNKRMEEV